MWFCYEKSISGWSPVVYHLNKPNSGESKSLNGSLVKRSQIWEVPEDCKDTSGEPMFGRLQVKFPKPKPETFDEPPIVLS